MKLVRAVHSFRQRLFNVGSATRAGNERHRSRRVIVRVKPSLHSRQKFGHAWYDATRIQQTHMHQRQQRDQPVMLSAGDQNQRAGVCDSMVG
jgi:hypothetical protein